MILIQYKIELTQYFYTELKERLSSKLGLEGGEIFAYKITQGSNLRFT